MYVCGQEKTRDTVNLAKMNLAVNGLRGEIKQANTYYEDPYQSLGAFDYVLANPPFNVDDVSLSSVEKDKRFNTYGIPRNKSKVKKADEGKETVPNGNYLWINLFATTAAVRAVDPDLIELANAFGRRDQWSKLWPVILPAAAPGILAGVRTGLGQAWMAVVAAELFGVPGIGQRMNQAASLIASEIVVVCMLTIAVLYGVMDMLFLVVQRRIMRWQA